MQVKAARRLTLRLLPSMFPGSFAGQPAVVRAQISPEVVVPRIQSAKKRMRQAKTHTALNRTQRSQLRSAIKKVRGAAADAAQAAYDEAAKLIDRAGRKRLIHPNAAARQKSRLAKLVKGGAKK